MEPPETSQYRSVLKLPLLNSNCAAMQAEPLTRISQQTLTLAGLAMEHGLDLLHPPSRAAVAQMST
jgi:hypothetical protein